MNYERNATGIFIIMMNEVEDDVSAEGTDPAQQYYPQQPGDIRLVGTFSWDKQ